MSGVGKSTDTPAGQIVADPQTPVVDTSPQTPVVDTSPQTPVVNAEDRIDAPRAQSTQQTPRDPLDPTGSGGAIDLTTDEAALRRLRATIRLEQAQPLIEAEEAEALGQVAVSLAAQGMVAELSRQMTTAPDQVDAATAADQLDQMLAQVDAEIATAEQRRARLEPLRSLSERDVAGRPNQAASRAEALLAFGAAVTINQDGRQIDAGTLPDRIAALQDARTSLALMRANLEVALRPDKSNAALVAPLRAELDRLTPMLAGVQRALADARSAGLAEDAAQLALLTLQRQQLQGLISDIQAQITQIRNRWQPALQQLGGIAQVLGVERPAGAEMQDVVALLRGIERAMGLGSPALPRGKAGIEALQQRMMQVGIARRQGAALVAAWLMQDGGLSAAQLVDSGLLTGEPNQLGAAELRRIGLQNATPGRLTEQQQQFALVSLVSADPSKATAALDRLYEVLHLEGREPQRDMRELVRLARTGRARIEPHQRYPSLVALRQDWLADRRVISAGELRLLSAYGGRSLAQLAAGRSLGIDVRRIASKLAANERIAAHIAPGGTLSSSRVSALAGRIAGFDYHEGDARILTEQDVQILDRLLARAGTITSTQLDTLLQRRGEESPTLGRVSLSAPELSVLARIAQHDGVRRALLGDGRLTIAELEPFSARLGEFTRQVESFDGKMMLAGFYDPAQLDRDAQALYQAMKGCGTDNAEIWSTLEPRTHAERQVLVAQFAGYLKARGYDDVDPGALYHWLEDDQSGWQLGKSMHLLTRRRLGSDWAADLRDGPASLQKSSLFELRDGTTVDLRTPEGRLAWEKACYQIFSRPYGVRDMDDSTGVRAWRHADQQARTALAAYERAVASNDAAQIERTRQAFTDRAGVAIAKHKTLSETYTAQAQADIEFWEATTRYVQIGAVVVVATAATIATAGTAAAGGATLVAAAGKGIIWGTVAGTATGFSMRVARETAEQGMDIWEAHRLDADSWKTIGAGTVEDFKMAAGTSIAAAIPTAGFGRLGSLANAAAKGAHLTRLQGLAVAFQQTIPRVVHMSAASAAFTAAGSTGMRLTHEGVHLSVEALRDMEGAPQWLTSTLGQVNTQRSEDLELSWKNFFIEVGSGAISGGMNRYLGLFDDAVRSTSSARTSIAARLGRSLLTTGKRSLGFGIDMGMNLADESVRNALYGRAWDEGLTDALVLGAPGQIAGSFAARRFAAQADARARGDTDTPDPGRFGPMPDPTEDGSVATIGRAGAKTEPVAPDTLAAGAGPAKVSEIGRYASVPQSLTPAQRSHLGEAGRTWFDGLSPNDKRAAKVAMQAMEARGVATAFDPHHYSAMVTLLRNGVPDDVVASLSPAAAGKLQAALPDLLKSAFYIDAADAGPGGKHILESQTQETWNAIAKEIGDPVVTRRIGESLRPGLSLSDWRPILQRLHETPAGRAFLTEYRRSCFAKSAYLDIERRWGHLPAGEQPDVQTVLRWYRNRWNRISKRYNEGLGAKHGIKLEGTPPGLNGAPPRSLAELQTRLLGDSFSVYSGINDPFQSRLGYAGPSRRSSLGTQDINLLSFTGGRFGASTNTDAKVAILLHEFDHVKRGFSYRSDRTAEAVAYNLLGEALAPLHEMSVFDTGRLRTLVSDDAAMYRWLRDTLATYAEPSVVGPQYFALAAGQDGDPVRMVLNKLKEVAAAGSHADPVANLTAVLQDPAGTGMLGSLDTRAPAQAVSAAIDLRRQETLRRVGLSDDQIADAVTQRSWDARTADQAVDLVRNDTLAADQLSQLSAGEVDLLWQALIDLQGSPRTERLGFRYGKQLSPEQARAIARSPKLLEGASINALRTLSPQHLDALGRVPDLVTKVKLETIVELEPQQIVPYRQRLAVAEELVDAGLPKSLVDTLKEGDGLVRLQHLAEAARTRTLTSDDANLRALLEDLPTTVLESGWRQPGLRDWLAAHGVELPRQNRSSGELHVDPEEVPAGLTQNEAELARARQMLQAEGFDPAQLAGLQGPELVRLWSASFIKRDSYAQAFADTRDAMRVAAENGNPEATHQLGEQILTRHLARTLERQGLPPELIAGLRRDGLEKVRHLHDAAVRYGVDSRDVGHVEDALRLSLPDEHVDAIVASIIDARTRQLLVAGGADPTAVAGLSAADVAAIARLRRLDVLGAPAAASERILASLQQLSPRSRILASLETLGREGTLGTLRPGLYQMRQDLVALGGDPQLVSQISGPALLRLYDARTTAWGHEASAKVAIATGVKPAALSSDPIDAVVAQLRQVQDWGFETVAAGTSESAQPRVRRRVEVEAEPAAAAKPTESLEEIARRQTWDHDKWTWTKVNTWPTRWLSHHRGVQMQDIIAPESVPLLAELVRKTAQHDGNGPIDGLPPEMTKTSQLLRRICAAYDAKRKELGTQLARSGTYDPADHGAYRLTNAQLKAALGLSASVNLQEVSSALTISAGSRALAEFVLTQDFPMQAANAIKAVADAIAGTPGKDPVVRALAGRVQAELQGMTSGNREQVLARIEDWAQRFAVLGRSQHYGRSLPAVLEAVLDSPHSTADLRALLADPEVLQIIRGSRQEGWVAAMATDAPVEVVRDRMKLVAALREQGRVPEVALWVAFQGGEPGLRQAILDTLPARISSALDAVPSQTLFELAAQPGALDVLASGRVPGAADVVAKGGLSGTERAAQLVTSQRLVDAGVDPARVGRALSEGRSALAALIVDTLGAAASPKALHDAATKLFADGKLPEALDVAALKARWDGLPASIRSMMLQTLAKHATPAQAQRIKALSSGESAAVGRVTNP